MTMKEKLLMLLIVMTVIGVLMLTHVAGHLAFLISHCFALVLPALKL
jgi:hypothetical protein